MAQYLSLNPISSWSRPDLNGFHFHNAGNGRQSWISLQRQVKCNGKFTCLFPGNGSNRKEEQARKALESALGGKKNEFKKWNEEIKRREEAGGGGDSGGGGWFGWGRWYNGDNFWPEAQQTGLAILGILVMYLVVAKGEVMLAVIINPALHALRGARNGFTLISSRILKNSTLDSHADKPKEINTQDSAKARVLRKWASD